ncbi:MAG: hypothetical protein E7256_10190 [Lachnospiraceae bacterium]|nr:hypothetical protein [Lachnospiraceae bacterium]
MKEQLYTIPVNEAFEKECECPVCAMYRSLEQGAIEFVMGPSYMEDDVRMETDQKGFCERHLKMMYKNQNRLGLALMLHTHMKRTIADLEKISQTDKEEKKAVFFKKKEEGSQVKAYVDRLEQSCYVCERTERIFARYITTIFYLYRTDESFRKKLTESKGICTKHYGLLYEEAKNQLGSKEAALFRTELNQLYLTNMKRVRDDLEWYTDKFDYRYKEEPWKNSKDAVPRTLLKTRGIWEDELE